MPATAREKASLASQVWPITLAQLRAARWTLHDRNPVISPPPLSPVIADPTFVVPEHSPDGRWHLFAHSLFGIHHFTSEDSVDWRRGPLVQRNALRPCLFRDEHGYTLLYERARRGRIPLHWLAGRRWYSWIEMMRSEDLVHWNAPRSLLAPSLAWHGADRSSGGRGRAVSNPCLVRTEGEYRLYYSAGLELIPDCGFCEPAAIGMARSDHMEGPYAPLPEPLIVADPGRPWANLAAGAMKVRRLVDGWVAFQNGIYWDQSAGRSGSAILLLESTDGVHWRQAVPDPILAPTDGWMRAHVYALDVHLDGQGQLVLFFNARSAWHWSRGVERIGLLIGHL